ncbi:hypothetical protein CF8_0128 [Aeromonas phage CF8]|nr:hypothetical protein CF8_0128 [Aeromonas phage CF8]
MYVPDWKPQPPRMEQLNQYLAMNDCTRTTARETCYKTTRLILIATTKELDVTNARVTGLNESIDQLIASINLIIDELSASDKK